MKKKYSAQTTKDTKALAQKIRGMDMFDMATKLCQINLFLHGDCHDNVVRCDSLDPNSLPDWIVRAVRNPEEHGLQFIMTNPPFGAKEGTRLEREWSKTLCEHWREHNVKDMFECAVDKDGYRDLQPQSPFVELCVKLLRKPKAPGAGGKLGIVIDNGLVSNTNKEEPLVRSIVRRECIIEAVVGLPKGTFKPYGSNVIPDFLIVRRRHHTEEQGPIFRAEALQIGLVSGLTSYKEASDEDLKSILVAWSKWTGRDANVGVA